MQLMRKTCRPCWEHLDAWPQSCWASTLASASESLSGSRPEHRSSPAMDWTTWATHLWSTHSPSLPPWQSRSVNDTPPVTSLLSPVARFWHESKTAMDVESLMAPRAPVENLQCTKALQIKEYGSNANAIGQLETLCENDSIAHCLGIFNGALGPAAMTVSTHGDAEWHILAIVVLCTMK